MKNNILWAFLFFAFTAKSQNQRFIYDVQYKKDSTSHILTKENYILDIIKNDVLYYTRDFFVADSLISNNIPFPKDIKLNTSNIISHQIGNNSFDEYDLFENTVLKLQTSSSQNWKLTEEKKTDKKHHFTKSYHLLGRKKLDCMVHTRNTSTGGPLQISWITRSDRGNI